MASVIRIRSIEQVPARDGRGARLLLSWDEDGEAHCADVPDDDDADRAVREFLDGAIDADGLVEALTRPDARARALSERVASMARTLGGRVAWDGERLLVDGRPLEALGVDEALDGHAARMLASGRDSQADWAALFRFTEGLADVADPDVRGQLATWLLAQGCLTLLPDGRFVGWRGCAWDEGRRVPVSAHSGDATVEWPDGRVTHVVCDHVPNPVGGTVSMPREQVTRDACVGCSRGLHVGTFDYAASWAAGCGAGARLLRVAVAPADVVSVPVECGAAKLRCCRFEVLSCTGASWDEGEEREGNEARFTWPCMERGYDARRDDEHVARVLAMGDEEEEEEEWDEGEGEEEDEDEEEEWDEYW